MIKLILLVLVLLFLVLLLVSIRKQEKAVLQPAKESYFFSDSFKDLKKIRALTKEMNKISVENSMMPVKIMVSVLGGLLVFITSTLHNILFVCIFFIVYFVFFIVSIIDMIYNLINKISTACPNPVCQATFLLPNYECSMCGAIHTNLVPGKYGILKRKCNCGNKLSTSFINGRGKIKAYCPVCGFSLNGDTNNRQFAIQVIGGPSVGKTCFINTAVYNLKNKIAEEMKWQISFIDKNNERDCDDIISNMKKGRKPTKTDDGVLTAYQLSIKLSKSAVLRRLYIYDIMGEAFLKSDTTKINRAFSYTNGIIFLIDPLSIPDFAMELVEDNVLMENGASKADLNDVFEGLLEGLFSVMGIKSNSALPVNLAVVINKCDIKKIEESIGEPAIDNYIQNNKNSSKLDASNFLCREFLYKYNSGNFVKLVEKKFKKVQYFSCSSLDTKNNRLGNNVEKPVLWILNQVDSSFKVNLKNK